MTHTLKSFAYGYPCPPSASQIRTGSAVMVPSGAQVRLLRVVGAYSVVHTRGLTVPVLSIELAPIVD